MSFVRKVGSGEFVVCHQTNSGTPHHGRYMNSKTYQDWFLVKAVSGGGAILVNKTIVCPLELLGKRVRVKLEIIEDDVKGGDEL